MARVPLGEWKPSTDAEDEALTDFENEGLRREVERDARAHVNELSEPQSYLIDAQVLVVTPPVVKALLDAD